MCVLTSDLLVNLLTCRGLDIAYGDMVNIGLGNGLLTDAIRRLPGWELAHQQ